MQPSLLVYSHLDFWESEISLWNGSLRTHGRLYIRRKESIGSSCQQWCLNWARRKRKIHLDWCAGDKNDDGKIMMKAFWPLDFFAASRRMIPFRGGIDILVSGPGQRRSTAMHSLPKSRHHTGITVLKEFLGEKSHAWNITKELSPGRFLPRLTSQLWTEKKLDQIFAVPSASLLLRQDAWSY